MRQHRSAQFRKLEGPGWST